MRTIGLTGLAGSGKDTAGKYLSESLGLETIAFADEVRDILWTLDIPLYSHITGPTTYRGAINEFGYDSVKRAFPKVREFMDSLSTKIIRNRINDNYFVDIAVEKAKDIGSVVITDARFDNEKKAIKEELNGIVIEIVRPGITNLGLESEDISNRFVDITIINDGSKEDLFRKLDREVLSEL